MRVLGRFQQLTVLLLPLALLDVFEVLTIRLRSLFILLCQEFFSADDAVYEAVGADAVVVVPIQNAAILSFINKRLIQFLLFAAEIPHNI